MTRWPGRCCGSWPGTPPTASPGALLDGLADPPAVLRAVGRLAAYSMLTADDRHPCHAPAGAGRDPHPRPGRPPPRPPGDRRRPRPGHPPARRCHSPAGRTRRAGRRWRMLLPHIDALASHAPPDTDTQDTAYLLNQAGAFLDSQGQPGRAAGYLRRALAGRVRVLGGDHPDTLTSRNNLAHAYQAAGDLGRAIPLYEQILADQRAGAGRRPPPDPGLAEQPRLRLPGGGGPGPGHPAVRADPGRPACGSLGADHPQTLGSRNNLAGAYQAAGDLGRAIPLYEQALADRQRVLGADHPDTLTSRNNLAYAYQAAGDLGRAIPLYEQALADRQRVLGADHPDTLISRNNLAAAYCDSGGPGPGHPAARADPRRQRAGAGRRPPRYPAHRGTTSPMPMRRRGTWAGPSRCTSRSSPTGSGCWAPTTPTP